MALLSENDLRRLQRALSGMREDAFEITMGSVKLRASVVPAPSPWPVAMVARLEVWRPRIYSSQYFESVEKLREALNNTRLKNREVLKIMDKISTKLVYNIGSDKCASAPRRRS